MTSKNSLIVIERITPILRCRIVLRLRSAICILIFSIFTLLVQNKLLAQALEAAVDSNLYPTVVTGSTIPLESGYAILKFTLQPGLTSSSTRQVISADLVPSVTYYRGIHSGAYGWNEDLDNGNSVVYVITDGVKAYYRQSGNTIYIRQTQPFLEAKNFGTVHQRRNYILFLKSSFDVIPVNFASNLGLWILIGIAIALAIPPLWWVVKRFLR